MKTSEKPKIESKKTVIPCKRYGELIASEKRALPRLQKELDEANKLKRDSYVTMMSKRCKLKWDIWTDHINETFINKIESLVFLFLIHFNKNENRF